MDQFKIRSRVDLNTGGPTPGGGPTALKKQKHGCNSTRWKLRRKRLETHVLFVFNKASNISRCTVSTPLNQSTKEFDLAILPNLLSILLHSSPRLAKDIEDGADSGDGGI